jgi:single-strand DNA-binding protein
MAAGDTPITVVGNLVADPELRFTPAGQPVATFRVASTPRIMDRQTNEWKDGDSLFLTCNVWRQAAENVAESLQRGMRVIVTGRLKQRNYETKEGEKRTVYEVEVDDVGPSLRNASAKVNRASRGGGEGGFGGGNRSSGGGRPAAAAAGTRTRGRPTRAPAPGTPTSRRSNGTLLSEIPTIPASRGALLRSTTMAKPPVRKPKKKVCVFCQERISYVDYKDTGLLRKYISDRGKIRARRVSGNCTRHQRDVATAIKNAREMALLPYTSTAR